MRHEESGLGDTIFEGSVIARLGNENIVVESGIRYGFLNFRNILCFF